MAVVFADGADDVAETLGEYGATRVLVVDDPAIGDYLVAPKAEALAQLAEASSPAAILISSTADGREIAGRLAVKLGSGLITDATDIAADGTTTQSVFAGNWTGDRGGHPGHAGDHGEAQRADARARTGARPRSSASR